MCLPSANACPPEGVGDLGSYADILQAMVGPTHDANDAMWRLNGGPSCPRGLDINAVTGVDPGVAGPQTVTKGRARIGPAQS